jgi:hypothetical protein
MYRAAGGLPTLDRWEAPVNSMKEDYLIDLTDDSGQVSVRVTVPKSDGARILSDCERETLAGELAQNLALHLAECLITWRGEKTPVRVRKSNYSAHRRAAPNPMSGRSRHS